MALTTPGVDFLIYLFISLCIPGCLVKALFWSLGLPCSPLFLVLLCICSLPSYIIFKVQSTERAHRREAAAAGGRLVPRVQGRLLGNFDQLTTLVGKWLNGYPGDGFQDLVDEYGAAVNTRVLWTDSVFSCSPEYTKLILASGFENYVKGERFQQALGSVLGSGVFNSDGDMWKFHRSMTRPFFTRDRITHFHLFDRHAEKVLKKLRDRMEAGIAIDFQDLMSRFTMDVTTDFLFNQCVDSLSSPLPFPHNSGKGNGSTPQIHTRADEFSAAFTNALQLVAERERYGSIWPLYEITHDKVIGPMKIVKSFIEPIVREAVQKKAIRDSMNKNDKLFASSPNSKIDDDVTLLDHLVELTSDPVILRDEILNIMIAGRDTITSTLTFTIYLLCNHPEVAARLRGEILDQVGATALPSFEQVKDMKYLRAVINETLRLFPPVPFNVRECVNGTLWPSPDPNDKPLYLPAGTKTPYSVMMMQRRKDLWGPDADIFDPDRWLDERNQKYFLANPLIFLPFNAGPRICLGQLFAYNEMSILLIRLLQNFSSFNLELDAFPPGTLPPPRWAKEGGRKAIEKIRPKVHLTMYCHGGLWVRMQEPLSN
ncbi:cytochrome P450 [Pluteus cervinus]|uniref:Cytochrome P450 n=1 Tax=Pluteus cervinus TaxID=181527 RepID=A0ACD3AS32_9AGAR|nr:cytochrome P450 [Pluteus cervinus]